MKYKSEGHMVNKIKTLLKDIDIERNKKHSYIKNAELAAGWIDKYTIKDHAIAITSKTRKEYEEVTGYFIPTLLKWGFRDKAIAYAKWLCEVQTNDGAWRTSDGKYESIFNTGQVLRGLLAIYDILPEVKENMFKACDWLVKRMNSDGRMKAIDEKVWHSQHKNSELIHLYCLSPLKKIGIKFKRSEYVEAAEKSLRYYKRKYKDDILNFNYLSHFYAYCIEALIELGEIEIAQQAMNKVAKLQRIDGAVPAYRNCKWICSTGLFQFSVIWYKLGDYKRANKAFDYACKLQNKSGGWYGGYYPTAGLDNIYDYLEVTKPNYFPNEEISWAVKYFFDALWLRQNYYFNDCADTFIEKINRSDPKYRAIYNVVQEFAQGKILDVGCGKGRYLKRLYTDFDTVDLYGIDCSDKVLEYINNKKILTQRGSLLEIPFEDNKFDVVYTCEALEHAILTENAVKEMIRVLKRNGKLVIIDKTNDVIDKIKYESWFAPQELRTKQYFDAEELKLIMEKNGLKKVISRKAGSNNDIYTVWIGEKA